MSSSSKINVYSVSDLKNTTDDALPNYLNSLKFVQTHRYTDVRLALGWAAVVIAGALFYYDWKAGWSASKPWTLPAVVVYFGLNAAFTYWLWFVEKGLVYAGARDGVRIALYSSADKHVPVYKVTARFSTAQRQTTKELRIAAPFTRWFTSDGFFVARPFQQWLASEVAAVGEADPGNVVEEIGRGSGPQTEMNVDIDSLDKVLAGLKSQGQAQGKARRRA